MPVAGDPIYAYEIFTQINVQVFDSSGTWTKPGNAKVVRVRMVGAGGQAGGVTGAGSGIGQGGGGGGGGYCESVFAASALSATEAVGVGTGGSGSTAGSTGGNGGSSTFKTMTAGGGTGGGGTTSSTSGTSPAGGVGGTSSGGNVLNLEGERGDLGRTIGSDQHFRGFGGSSHWAPRTYGGLSVGSNGNAATSPGGGGGAPIASTTSRNGGAGADGKVIIETYI